MSTSTSPAPGLRDEPEAALPGVGLLLRRSWWIALGVVLGMVAGAAAGQFLPPRYESTAVVTVASTVPTDPVNTSRAAQALARLATESSVVDEPLRDAGLTEAAEDPRAFIRVQAAPDAPIVQVTGSATDAETAQDIAATVSAALADEGPFPPFTASVVAAPVRPAGATTPGWAVPAGGAAIGAVLALVLAATVPARGRSRRPAAAAPLPS